MSNSDLSNLRQSEPSDFGSWSLPAKRAWIAGQATQREMLNYLAESLGVNFYTDPDGPLTSRELAEFVAKATEHIHMGDGNDCSI
jgi:hypothetical protein